MQRFNPEAMPFYPVEDHPVEDDLVGDYQIIKRKRHIRAQILHLLYPDSQFLSENVIIDGYVNIVRIAGTRLLRRFPYEVIIKIMDNLVYSEALLEYDQTRSMIRFNHNSPIIIAKSVIDE